MTGRIVIVGGVAAGASAAAKARRTNESVEIVMFDRGPYMSYANCGLPYYVAGVYSMTGLIPWQNFEFSVQDG